jgi:hypothetical protein
MHRTRRTRFEVTALCGLAAALVATARCGDGGDTTGRVRVTFPVTVRGINATSDNSLGWHVVVEQAFAAVGPVRWYEGPPIFGRNLFERALGVGVAYAHPGHYVPGEALADITSQRVVDLTAATPTALEDATGVSGDSLSATFELRPPGASLGPSAAALHGLALWTRGTATRMGVTVRFEGGVAVDYAVRGIPARATFASGGSAAVAVNLAQWFDRADFSTLTAPSPDGTAPITMTSEVANGLYRGATNGSAYLFSWSASSPDR